MKISNIFRKHNKEPEIKERDWADNVSDAQDFFDQARRDLYNEMLSFVMDHSKQNQNNMDNLLKCHGRRFKANIKGIQCEGKISVINGSVFLCQNKIEGNFCSERFDYKYSWGVSEGSMEDMVKNDVYTFTVQPRTAAEIEAYKDWQVGDKVTDGHRVWEVIFRSGKLVVCENEGDCATSNFTCDELYDGRFRLVADPEPEDDTVELTLDQIAEKFGIKPENLRIKKEE